MTEPDGQLYSPQDSINSLGQLPGRAGRRIAEELNQDTRPSTFHPSGRNLLISLSEDFTESLGVEAIHIAWSLNRSVIERPDVEDAYRKLIKNKAMDKETDKRAWVLALAGVSGGAATSASIAMLLSATPVTHASYWWSSIVILGIIATILFARSYPSHGSDKLESKT